MGLIVATGLGAEGPDLGSRGGDPSPKGSVGQQQRQHSRTALTGVEMTGVGRQSWLLQTAGV